MINLSKFKYKEDLCDVYSWTLDKKNRIELVIEDLCIAVKSEFEFKYLKKYGYNEEMLELLIPTFQHLKSEMLFQFVPGGKFIFGLSKEEEVNLKRLSFSLNEDDYDYMKPFMELYVAPFFLAKFPLLKEFVHSNIKIDKDIYRAEFGNGNPNEILPIYLTLFEINQVFKKFDFSLPSEVQLEYAMRGGNNHLFYFGNELPYNEEIIENGLCLVDFWNEEINNKYANSFGLCGLGVGEWCFDSWFESHEKINENERYFNDSKSIYKVVKGGAAYSWPWQTDNEWLLGVTAMRLSSEWLDDNTCGARPLVQIII